MMATEIVSSSLTKFRLLSVYLQLFAVVVLSLVCMAALYQETVFSLISVWNSSETYSHCYFILPLFCYLVYSHRQQLTKPLEPSPLLAPLIILPAGIWLIGIVAEINIFTHAGVTGMLLGMIVTIVGWRSFKEVFPYITFLVFLVPFGDEIVPELVDITADFTVATLRFFNYPLYRQGNHFTLPTGRWSIVEACSGVRYLMASVTIGYVYAILNYQKTHKRLMFIVFSAIVPIVANGFRAVMIVLLGHYSGMTIAVGVDHLVYGWLFFGVVIFVLFWVGRYWQDPDPEPKNNLSDSSARQIRPYQAIFTFVVLSGLLIIPSSWEKRISYHAGYNTVPWSDESVETGWEPDYLAPDHLDKAELTLDSGESFFLRLYTYGTKRHGNELASTQNQLVKPGNDESILLEKDKISVSYKNQEFVYDRGIVESPSGVFSVARLQLVGQKSMNSLLEIKLAVAINRLANTPESAKALFVLEPYTGRSNAEMIDSERLKEVTEFVMDSIK